LSNTTTPTPCGQGGVYIQVGRRHLRPSPDHQREGMGLLGMVHNRARYGSIPPPGFKVIDQAASIDFTAPE
jgi:hypothetical protein